MVLDNGAKIEDILRSIDDGKYQLRLEEIPHDQLTVAADEHLAPVLQIYADPTVAIGASFFVKVKQNERFESIKRKIKGALKVPLNDGTKYNFYIYQGVKKVMTLDDVGQIDFDYLWRHSNLPLPECPIIAIEKVMLDEGEPMTQDMV